MRCIEEFETVQRLIAAGVDDCAIARQTGIPRCTVRDWRLRPQSGPGRWAHQSAGASMNSQHSQRQRIAIVLGLYLGDGCISRHPTRVAAEDRSRRQIPQDHRPLPRGHRRTDAGPAGGGATPSQQLH